MELLHDLVIFAVLHIVGAVSKFTCLKEVDKHTGPGRSRMENTATELLPVILLRDTGMVMSDLLILKRVGNLDFIYVIRELCF